MKQRGEEKILEKIIIECNAKTNSGKKCIIKFIINYTL